MELQWKRFDVKLWSILLLATVLRLYDLGGESLWIDEGQTVAYAVKSFEEIVKYCARDVHPPLYLFILHAWTEIFGISEVALRFPSALFGILSVWLTYLLGHRLIGRTGALWGTLFMALSYMGINFSQEARSYTLLLTAILMACHALILYEKKPTKLRIFYYAASVALMLYIHTFTVFIIFFHQLYFLVTLKWRSGHVLKDIGTWIGVNVLALILFSPWIYFLLKQVLAKLGGEGPGSWVPVPDIHVAYRTFIQLSGGLLPMIAACIAIGIYLAIRFIPFFRTYCPYKASMNAPIFLGLWFFGAIIIPFTISLLLAPIYVERYAIQFLPGFCLFLGLMIAGTSPAVLKHTVATLFILGSVYGLWNYYTMLDKEQWREVAQFVKENIKPGQAVVLSAPWIYEPFTYYFADDGELPIIPAFDFVDVKEEVKDIDGVWLIQAHEFFSDPEGKIPMQLADGRLIKKHKDFKEGAKTNPVLVHFQSIRATFYNSGQASEFLQMGLSDPEERSLIPGLSDAGLTEKTGLAVFRSDSHTTITTSPDTRLKYLLEEQTKVGEGALSLWFKLSAHPKDADKQMLVMAKGPQWDKNTLFVETTRKNGVRTILFGTGSFLGMAEGRPLPWEKDTWRHLIISWDRKDLTLYLDGQKYAVSRLPRPFQSDFKTLHLGADHQNSFPAPGLYDDLIVFSGPIDPQTAKDLYNGTIDRPSIDYWYDLDLNGIRSKNTGGNQGVESGTDTFFLTTVPDLPDSKFLRGSASFTFVPHWDGNEEKQRVLLSLLGQNWNKGSVFLEKTPKGFLQAIRWENETVSAVIGQDISSWQQGSTHSIKLAWTPSKLNLTIDGKTYSTACNPSATAPFKAITIGNDASFTLPAEGVYQAITFTQ
ncbi:hypothetical protein GO013_07455 [Pseudodesulfovibrio sp. JC047]|uniref:glycosyltransferase family 39 protein n=1 Tax=Pseudodesulfovibrio sp. JC047 TaxID=2683199 RepID=UPI0013D56979|nr:glycosyltransferase family 39 protein [Pseudodesulfovibrio sp. JC047]NDV19255.1 hypothetical protein [Pseudodesulfovibrio sp. JC047]